MARFSRINKKVSLNEIAQKRLEEHENKISAIQADTEKNRLEYEAKFNKFRQDTMNSRRIDYKVYGGMETWHYNED